MAIGEFGGAPALPAMTARCIASPAVLALRDEPRGAQSVARLRRCDPAVFQESGQSLVATRRSARPSPPRASCSSARPAATASPTGTSTRPAVGGEHVPVHIETVWERPFCRLLHFERAFEHPPRRPQPRLLIVAPMSGHYATLLRGTVEAFLPNHDVYITDWIDARMVPLSEGRFDLDDYIDYVISILHLLGGDAHVMAVCQPSVPVLAAVALHGGRRRPARAAARWC